MTRRRRVLIAVLAAVAVCSLGAVIASQLLPVNVEAGAPGPGISVIQRHHRSPKSEGVHVIPIATHQPSVVPDSESCHMLAAFASSYTKGSVHYTGAPADPTCFVTDQQGSRIYLSLSKPQPQYDFTRGDVTAYYCSLVKEFGEQVPSFCPALPHVAANTGYCAATPWTGFVVLFTAPTTWCNSPVGSDGSTGQVLVFLSGSTAGYMYTTTPRGSGNVALAGDIELMAAKAIRYLYNLN